MKITVKLFATLRQNNPKKQQLELPKHSLVKAVFDKTGIDSDLVSIIMVNGIIVDTEYLLHPDDTVSFFPPVGGG